MVEVTNLDNGRTLQLRVNDRGPFVDGRLIDLSMGAADKLGVLRPGLARVRVRYVGPAPDALQPATGPVQYASATPPPRTPKPAPPQRPPLSAAGSLPNLDDETPRPLHEPEVALAAAAPEPLPAPVEPSVVADIPPPGPMVVASATIPDPPVPTPRPAVVAAPVSGRYAIQAAAFSSRANAEKAASQLASIGPVDITTIERNGGVLYRVTVRSLKDAGAADDALERVSASGFPGAQIIGPQ
jgi:rare lipoprotein A